MYHALGDPFTRGLARLNCKTISESLDLQEKDDDLHENGDNDFSIGVECNIPTVTTIHSSRNLVMLSATMVGECSDQSTVLWSKDRVFHTQCSSCTIQSEMIRVT